MLTHAHTGTMAILEAIQRFRQDMTAGKDMLGLTIIVNDLRITVCPPAPLAAPATVFITRPAGQPASRPAGQPSSRPAGQPAVPAGACSPV